jgi:DNA-binding response OmpR family regulator
MSGWEVFDRIKENPSWNTIPVIFLTARTDRIAKNAGSFLGEDYIEKPFEIVDLKNRIEKVFHNKASKKTLVDK